jgi:nucleoporin NUP82
MPKIKSYVPSWLHEPAPGHKLFVPATDESRPPNQQLYSNKSKPGPHRTIARRGTEVFVAVGKQIRWGNLAHLKEGWEAKQAKSIFGSRPKKEALDGSFELYDEEAENHPEQNGPGSEGYRVCSAPLCPFGSPLIRY